MTKIPTIKDVAAYAGVSSATVSHVINGTRFVSETTSAKVHEAIRALSFTPNASARSFKTGKRNTIGIIVPDISNLYFANIIEEAERTIQKKGYSLIVANTQETRQREIHQLRTLSSGMVDGIILASTQKDYEDITLCLPENFPVVLLDRTPKNSQADSVLASDSDSIRQGFQALVDDGHTRIGFIAGLRRLSTTEERLNAYRAGLEQNSIPWRPELVKYADSMAQSACNCTQELIEAQCTAIIVGNNVMTVDTISFVQHHLAKGGEAVQVLGYSYNDWYSWLPNIGCIVQPDREIGHAAGNQILRRIEKPNAPIQSISFNSYFRQT